MAVALQIAAALEEVHRKGLVHRDLKPANVKVGPDGHVKVFDFGIAKPVVETGARTPGGAATVTGVVPGTAPYMSPEQIRGEAVDGRTDVWAFGCILFEMLSGERAFPGATVPVIMAAVLRDPVRWERLPPGTPPALRRLVHRCLRREPKDRLQAIGDARLALAGGFAAPFALAPDGARVGVVVLDRGVRRLAVRSLGQLEVKVLEGTDGAWQPVFSPDGRELAFFADRKLRKVRPG